MKKELNKISEAIEAIKNGEIIIVVDDESRENEGDFVCASSKITPEIINFMSKEGRGILGTGGAPYPPGPLRPLFTPRQPLHYT